MPSTSSVEKFADGIELVGGGPKVASFPHARHNCLKNPVNFSIASKSSESYLRDQTCNYCYCYVCDVPTSECQEWDDKGRHYNAKGTGQTWKRLRELKKRNPTRKYPGPSARALNSRNPFRPNYDASKYNKPKFSEHDRIEISTLSTAVPESSRTMIGTFRKETFHTGAPFFWNEEEGDWVIPVNIRDQTNGLSLDLYVLNRYVKKCPCALLRGPTCPINFAMSTRVEPKNRESDIIRTEEMRDLIRDSEPETILSRFPKGAVGKVVSRPYLTIGPTPGAFTWLVEVWLPGIRSQSFDVHDLMQSRRDCVSPFGTSATVIKEGSRVELKVSTETDYISHSSSGAKLRFPAKAVAKVTSTKFCLITGDATATCRMDLTSNEIHSTSNEDKIVIRSFSIPVPAYLLKSSKRPLSSYPCPSWKVGQLLVLKNQNIVGRWTFKFDDGTLGNGLWPSGNIVGRLVTQFDYSFEEGQICCDVDVPNMTRLLRVPIHILQAANAENSIGPVPPANYGTVVQLKKNLQKGSVRVGTLKELSKSKRCYTVPENLEYYKKGCVGIIENIIMHTVEDGNGGDSFEWHF